MKAANDNQVREYVYFIHSPDQDAVKVGYSSGANRLHTLQTGNPAPLRLLARMPAGRDVEQALHTTLKPFHISREWFVDDDLFTVMMFGDIHDLAHYAIGEDRLVTIDEAVKMAKENVADQLAWIAAGRPTGEALEHFVP